MDEDLSLKLGGHSALAAFVTEANEVLSFKLVRSKSAIDQVETENDELTSESSFGPEMTHQIYGEQEKIFGYQGLHIDMWMTAGSLKAYIQKSALETLPESDGVGPDPVVEPLLKLLAVDQVATSKENFIKALNEENSKFKPLGEKIKEYQLEDQHFEVYHSTVEVDGFREYHSRLQPWIMFYIDAASYIDIDDSNWQFFLVFEKYTCPQDAATRYAVVGYVTVYEYYAYPMNKRPRISQMLVLPPFQGLGHGAFLLNTVNEHYRTRDNVVDITVEDPSDAFIRLRDFVDSRNCMTLEAFSMDKLKRGYKHEMAEASNKHFKLCKRQSRVIYEILRLWYTDRHNEAEYKAYRVDVKTRLNQPFQKQSNQLEKLKKVLSPEEFAAATMNLTNREQRLETLAKDYKDLEEHYNMIIERLNKHADRTSRIMSPISSVQI